MRRLLYLGYYLKNLDREKFIIFLRFTSLQKNTSKLRLLMDIIVSSLRYNISLLEYFQFRFYEKDFQLRKLWAGTGYMYEYQLIMNPTDKRDLLDDKKLFYRSYGKYMKHLVADIQDIQQNPELINILLNNPSGKLVLKVFNGKCGQQVLIKKAEDLKSGNLIEFMTSNGFDIVEEYIIQHPAFMKLSPSAVNTVRIFTQLDVNDDVEILGCRLRISVNSDVDNMAAGNIAAPIEENTGVIYESAVYSDITRPDEPVHPITGVPIIGFQIPFWEETIELVKGAAKLHPQNRSIGWDIAMTADGPDLIEGNHDWCKLVWQLPVRQGLKPILEKHLEEYTHKQ